MKKFGRAAWKEGPLAAFAAAAMPVVSLISGGIGLMNALKKPKMPNMPSMPGMLQSAEAKSLEKPTAMPVSDSQLTQEAKRKAIVAASQRGGRASTFLSDSGGDTFGG